QRREVLVAGKLTALHVVERAKEVAHALWHVLHVFVRLPAGPIGSIVPARRIELGELGVELGGGVCGFRFCPRDGERGWNFGDIRDRCHASEYVWPDDCSVPGNTITLIMPDH